MIYGAHAVIFSRAPAEARALLDKILEGTRVDAGGGWLIFALPPAEIAVHPTDGTPGHDLYLMCQDIEKTITELREKGVKFSRPVQEASWGRTTAFALPGGGELGLYQPRHTMALARPVSSAKRGSRRAGTGAAPSKSRKPAQRTAASRAAGSGGR